MAENQGNEQEMQEKYMRIQLLNQEYEQIYNNIEFINNRSEELNNLKGSLDDLENSEGYSQLGSGIFMASKIVDKNNFLVNVGKRLYVKMNKEQVKSFLDRKINDLKSNLSQLSKRKDELEKQLQKEVAELQSYHQGSQAPQAS